VYLATKKLLDEQPHWAPIITACFQLSEESSDGALIAPVHLPIVDRHAFGANSYPAAVIGPKRLAYRVGTVVCPLAVIVLVFSMFVGTLSLHKAAQMRGYFHTISTGRDFHHFPSAL
jgi:hypothetical protein